MRKFGDKLPLLSYASGLGAGNKGCSEGPLQLKQSPHLKSINSRLSWSDFITPTPSPKNKPVLPAIGLLNEHLADLAAELVAKRQFFVTLGGDHSCAIGTWSGAATAIAPLPLGLLWIDAHLDAHTSETTPSGNVHGMPLAALLGKGEKTLTEILGLTPKLLPKNVCILGARSFEPQEQQLLEELRVKIFYADEILEKGFEPIFSQAIEIITQYSAFFGVSIDLDAINPDEAPGVGTPELNGITAQALYNAIDQILHDPRFLAAEIVEFNPSLDESGKTEMIAAHLIKQFVNKIGPLNHEQA